jgi:hypothetical protein
LHRAHHRVVDLVPVRLAEAYDQNPVVRNGAEFAESLIRRDEKARFRSCHPPQLGIEKPLRERSANVFHIAAECRQSVHRHAGDVLIHKNSHPSQVHGLKGSHLFLG